MNDLFLLIFFPGALSFILYPMLAMRLERKTLARIHSRIGPKHAGPRGILQTLYDLLKVLIKQHIIPKRADRFAYVIVPQLAVIFLGVALMAMPIRPQGAFLKVAYSLLFVTAIFTALPVIFAVAARASNNKYAIMGGSRSVISFIGFEVAKLTTIISIARVVGSWDLVDIINRQKTHGMLVIYLPLAFVLLFIITLVETERPPFDAPETEAEVAFGIATEYSSILLAVRIATGYITLYALSSLITITLLGGYHGIALRIIPQDSVRRFILKLSIVTRLFFVLRGGLARYRPDQLVRYGRRIAMLLAYINLIRAGYLIREVL